MYGQQFQQRMDPLGIVASPARGQLNRGKVFSLSPFAPENLVGLAVPSPVSPLILHTQAKSGSLLMGFLPLSATASIYTVNHRRVGPEFIASSNCVPMALTAESPKAQGQ